ncbi:hypothetical protein D3C80_1539950 [compost metagenome]
MAQQAALHVLMAVNVHIQTYHPLSVHLVSIAPQIVQTVFHVPLECIQAMVHLIALSALQDFSAPNHHYHRLNVQEDIPQVQDKLIVLFVLLEHIQIVIELFVFYVSWARNAPILLSIHKLVQQDIILSQDNHLAHHVLQDPNAHLPSPFLHYALVGTPLREVQHAQRVPLVSSA